MEMSRSSSPVHRIFARQARVPAVVVERDTNERNRPKAVRSARGGFDPQLCRTRPSFASLGAGVHERAKRLKQEGVIRAAAALLDGAKIGRPLLAFVHVDTTSWAVTRQLLKFKELPEVEEIHTVTGESAMLLKVRTRDTQSLDGVTGRPAK